VFFLERFDFETPKIETRITAIIFILILIGFLAFISVGRINIGYVAVVLDPLFRTTSVVGNGQNAQYFIKPPWASTSRIYVATDSVNMRAEGIEPGDFAAVDSLTKDGLKVIVDITVRWSISPDGVLELFRKYPRLDWRERAIVPIIRETIRNQFVDYSAIQTIEQRGIIGVILEEGLIEAIDGEASLANSVKLEAVNIRNIVLPETFVNSIELKLAAEQLSIAAEFNKTRLLVLANATAQSAIINAEGLSKSRLILANATRDAVMVIASENQDLSSEEIVQLYMYLETLKDIAESGKGQFIIIPDEGQYILPIK
jgi:regulator of protease activity HflC (stomatin/prohibitin superfamily)